MVENYLWTALFTASTTARFTFTTDNRRVQIDIRCIARRSILCAKYKIHRSNIVVDNIFNCNFGNRRQSTLLVNCIFPSLQRDVQCVSR